MKFLITISIISCSILGLNAQTECSSFHRRSCGDKEGAVMKYDSQSKSAAMAKGQTSSFHMISYNGIDYRISVCAEEMLGAEVQYKIFQKSRVLIKEGEEDNNQNSNQSGSYDRGDETYSEDSYSEDSYSSNSYSDRYSQETSSVPNNEPKFRIEKELIYDNAEDSYSNVLEFTSDGTNSLIIEVTIPGDNDSKKLKIRDKI